jgi:hypothetical protein
MTEAVGMRVVDQHDIVEDRATAHAGKILIVALGMGFTVALIGHVLGEIGHLDEALIAFAEQLASSRAVASCMMSVTIGLPRSSR